MSSKKERILQNRRRRAASKGQHVRLSDLVINTLNVKRQNKMSWDVLFRRILGLPMRADEHQWIKNGRPQLLVEGFLVVPHDPNARFGRFYFSEAEANGYAVQDMTENKSNNFKKPIRMRELV